MHERRYWRGPERLVGLTGEFDWSSRIKLYNKSIGCFKYNPMLFFNRITNIRDEPKICKKVTT